MNTMHHSMAALSVAPDRPEGAARRTPPPSVRTAALTLLIAAMTAAGPTLANVECRPGAWTPDCMTQLAPAKPAPAQTPPAETPTATALATPSVGIYVGARISGTFRDQNRDGNTNTITADTVGGTFEMPDVMVGGFVATR